MFDVPDSDFVEDVDHAVVEAIDHVERQLVNGLAGRGIEDCSRAIAKGVKSPVRKQTREEEDGLARSVGIEKSKQIELAGSQTNHHRDRAAECCREKEASRQSVRVDSLDHPPHDGNECAERGKDEA